MSLRQRDLGYTSVVMMDGSGVYRLQADEHAKILCEWKNGVAFIDTFDFYGAVTSIKAGRIESVRLWTPEQIAAELEDVRLTKMDDIAMGTE